MYRLATILIIAALQVSFMADVGAAQHKSSLPKPCGGLERALVELDLERYQQLFSSPENAEFRQSIGVEALSPGATVAVVDEPPVCMHMIRAALEVLNGTILPVEKPSERVKRNRIRYEILRLGPYYLVMISPPKDARVAFMGYSSTLLVFSVEDHRFIDWFRG